MIEFCATQVPQWNTVSISGYHIREAGSTAVQELAFTLADGFHYVDTCLARGMDIDAFAPRLSFFFNAHNDIFEEIAKYRAARVLWAETLRHKYGARKENSWKLRFHAQTAGCSLQDKQPEVNLMRVAYQALAAVLGGCQSLHTNSMDETLALPSRTRRHAGPAHAAGAGLRNRRHQHRRSARRQLFRRNADQADAAAGPGVLRAHRAEGRHDRGPGGRLLPPRDRRRRLRLSARGGRQTQADRRRQRLPGDGREADGHAGRSTTRVEKEQIASLKAIKAKRDAADGAAGCWPRSAASPARRRT